METSTSPLHVNSKDGADSVPVHLPRLSTAALCPGAPQNGRPALRLSGSPCQWLQRRSDDNHKAPPPGFGKSTARDKSGSRFGSSHCRQCPDFSHRPWSAHQQRKFDQIRLRVNSHNSAKNLMHFSNNLLVCFYLISNTLSKGQQANDSDAVSKSVGFNCFLITLSLKENELIHIIHIVRISSPTMPTSDYAFKYSELFRLFLAFYSPTINA